jgi:hypothetical protein
MDRDRPARAGIGDRPVRAALVADRAVAGSEASMADRTRQRSRAEGRLARSMIRCAWLAISLVET